MADASFTSEAAGTYRAATTGYSGTDPANDVPNSSPYADILSTELAFDVSTITFKVTVAKVADLSNPDDVQAQRWKSGDFGLVVPLVFNQNSNGTDAVGGVLAVGSSPSGQLLGQGMSMYNPECSTSVSLTGTTFTVLSNAACYGQPGQISYAAVYGDIGNANNNDLSGIDSAPDAGLSPAAIAPGGYYLLGADGGVFAFGNAAFYGSTGNIRLNQPVVGMAASPGRTGYRFVASDGGVFCYGSAGFYGSTGSIPLNQPVVGITSTPSGNGYWMYASDGGIFAYGDAQFYGSTGSINLNKPIVTMSSTPSGNGYWLFASDGGVFAFGDAAFYGSAGSLRLNAPITSSAASLSGNGYLLLAGDGTIFSYGDSRYQGSPNGEGYGNAVAINVDGDGYRILHDSGIVSVFGAIHHFGDAFEAGIVPTEPLVGMALIGASA